MEQQQYMIEQQQYMIEQHQTNQNQDEHISWLRCIPIILMIIGLILMLTDNSQPSSMSYGMQTLTDALPYIEFGMIVIISLISLVVAFIVRKDAPILAIFLLIIAIVMPIIFWYFNFGIPQPQIIPVSH